MMGRKDERIDLLYRETERLRGAHHKACVERDEARAEVERLNRYADAATARADMAEAEASHWVHLLEGANGAVERVRAERDKAWDDLARYSKLPPLADGEEYASVGWWRGLDDAERERWEWRSVDGCGPWWTNQSGADDCEHIVVRERVPAAPEPDDDLYLALHGARERLCVAQVQSADPDERKRIGTIIARIDEAGSTLPAWSKANRAHEEAPEPTPVEVGQWRKSPGGPRRIAENAGLAANVLLETAKGERSTVLLAVAESWPLCEPPTVAIKARDLRAGMVEAETGRRLGSAAYWSLSDGTAVAVLASWLGTDTERVAPDALYTILVGSLPDGWQPSGEGDR